MRLGINGRFLAATLTGVQRFAYGLSSQLYGPDTVLFLPANSRAPTLPDSVTIVRGALSGPIWEQIELPIAVRRQRVDIVLHPANTAPRTGGPHAVVVHDVLALTHPHWFTRSYALWHRHVVRPAIARAQTLFTCSEWSAGEIVRSCGVRADKIAVITQGLDPFTGAADEGMVARTLTRYEIKKPYLLCTGLGDPRKNIGLLLQVVERLRKKHDQLSLVAVGARQPRVHAARSEPSPEWLHALSRVDDEELRALYTGAAAFCFPSHAEGFGRPPLEALACGTPALAGAYECAVEVLGSAVPILPNQIEPWVELLDTLLEDPQQRTRLVAQARPMLHRFQWSECARQVWQALGVAPVEVPV
jgi:glycosyltransferase involved in cell wall biosynthesis